MSEVPDGNQEEIPVKRFVLQIIILATLFVLIPPAGSLAAGQTPVSPMSGKDG